MSGIYRLICILDSIKSDSLDQDKILSEIDASPNYLHIHIAESKALESIDDFKLKLKQESKNNILFQFGIPLEKDAKTRSEKISASEIAKFGNIGIGSAARGLSEEKHDFIGGGEAFLFDKNNLRITKGNAVFKADDNQKYWAFQTADFDGAKIIPDFKNVKINGREELVEILKKKSEGRAFIATFDVEFVGDFFARSNGIFPEDEKYIENPKITLFEKSVKGGHLVGGSKNLGDIASLKTKFKSDDETNSIDFALIIKSDILLKPIEELQIAKTDGGFRKPRTEVEVLNAVKIIENYWQNYKTKN